MVRPMLEAVRSLPILPLQPVLFQPPHQHVEAVLAEERLAVEHHGGHTPMARGVQRPVVFGKRCFMVIRIGGHSILQIG